MIYTAERDHQRALRVSDLLAFMVSVVLCLRLGVLPLPSGPAFLHTWSGAALLISFLVLWSGTLTLARAYEFSLARPSQLYKVVRAGMLFTLIAWPILAIHESTLSKALVVAFVPITVTVALIFRRVITPLVLRLAGSMPHLRVLIVGQGNAASRLEQSFAARNGYRLYRFELQPAAARSGSGVDISQFITHLDNCDPHEVVVAMDGRSTEHLAAMREVCQQRQLPWQFVPHLENLDDIGVCTQVVGDLPLVGIKPSAFSGFNLFIKHCMDFLLGCILLMCAAPAMLVIWLAIRLDSKGGAILVQRRVGYKGKVFNFYKFRTMYVDAKDTSHRDYVQKWMQDQSYATAESRPKVFKITDDKRITRVGRVLRRYSLDELPQIFNVLKLEMSLVGPRPAMPYEVERYQDWHKERFGAPPGLTGAWQVAGRNRLSFNEMVKLDIQYIRNWSPVEDFRLLARTIPAVLRGTGY